MALKEVSGKKVNLSRAFKDIAFGLKRNSITKDSGVVKNENAIKQAIRCLVLTQKGERLFQPDIGCAVFELLFEPLDLMTADAVRDEIINTLNQYEPRISLIDVTVRVSDVLFSIPSFTTVPVAICDDTVNETSTSLVLDTALIISPSVNVPTMFCNSNSVTAN